jgi:hypothetical protein
MGYAIKSYNNTYLRHPMADPQWGRHPRKVDVNVDGPWRGATNDISTYSSSDRIDQDQYITQPSGIILIQ